MMMCWGPMGQAINALEEFCVALGWEYRVKAVQRDMLRDALDDFEKKCLVKWWMA